MERYTYIRKNLSLSLLVRLCFFLCIVAHEPFSRLSVDSDGICRSPQFGTRLVQFVYPTGRRAATGSRGIPRQQHLLLWGLLLSNKLFRHCDVAHRSFAAQLAAGEQCEKERRQLLQVIFHNRFRRLKLCSCVHKNGTKYKCVHHANL